MINIGWEVVKIFTSTTRSSQCEIFQFCLFSHRFFMKNWYIESFCHSLRILNLERKIFILIEKRKLMFFSVEQEVKWIRKFNQLFNPSIEAQISNFKYPSQLLLENLLMNDIQKLPWTWKLIKEIHISDHKFRSQNIHLSHCLFWTLFLHWEAMWKTNTKLCICFFDCSRTVIFTTITHKLMKIIKWISNILLKKELSNGNEKI